MKLNVPMPVKMAALVLGTTGFYTYLGQIVPQKEVQPPAEVAITADMTSEDLVAVGEELAGGKGNCLTCHNNTARYPDLDGIGTRAGTRIEGLSDIEYMAQSLFDPDTFLVPGYASGMPVINRPPIDLSDDEIRAVIAWLQSRGGTPTITLDTELGY